MGWAALFTSWALSFIAVLFGMVVLPHSVNVSQVSFPQSLTSTSETTTIASMVPTDSARSSAQTPSTTSGANATSPRCSDSNCGGSIYWVEKGHVYCNGTPLLNADAATFAPVFSIPQHIDAASPSLDNVAKDKNYVFSNCSVLVAADPNTFQIIYTEGGQWALAAKDARHVYFAIPTDTETGAASLKLLPGADASTFHVYGNFAQGYAADIAHVWRFDNYAGDNVIPQPTEISGADSNTFHVLQGQGSSVVFDWAADRYHVYYDGRTIVQADPTTVRLVCSTLESPFTDVRDCPYAEDSLHVFALVEKDNVTRFVVPVSGADPATFTLVDPAVTCGIECNVTAKDAYHAFDGQQVVSSVASPN